MSPLFETIKVKDGQFFNLDFHNARMNAARKAVYNCKDELDLSEKLYLPKSVTNAIHKCKVIYNQDLISIHFQPYYFRKINSLKIIQVKDIDYTYKSSDRSQINNLFTQKESFDDVLIVKDGLITDTSYANIIFFDGKNWFTPKHPLLKGTKRTKLLSEKRISEQEITMQMLPNFRFAKLINAMIDLEDTEPILIENIHA